MCKPLVALAHGTAELRANHPQQALASFQQAITADPGAPSYDYRKARVA